MHISIETTIKLPPGAIKEIEEITKDWKSSKGHTLAKWHVLDLKIQWFIMHMLNICKNMNEKDKQQLLEGDNT